MRNHNITPTKAFTFTAFLCSLSGGLHAKAPSQVKNYELSKNLAKRTLPPRPKSLDLDENDYLAPNSIFQGSYEHIYENDRGSDDHIYENDRGSDDHIYAEITHLDQNKYPRDFQLPTKAKSSSKEKLQRSKSFDLGTLRSFVKDTVSSITEKKRAGSLPNLAKRTLPPLPQDEDGYLVPNSIFQGKERDDRGSDDHTKAKSLNKEKLRNTLQRAKSFNFGSLRSFVKDTVSSITEKKRSGSLPNLSGENSLDAVVQEKIFNAVKRLKNSDEKNFEEAVQKEIRQYKKELHEDSIQTNEKKAALVRKEILEYDAQVESFKKGLREAIDSQNKNQEQVTEL